MRTLLSIVSAIILLTLSIGLNFQQCNDNQRLRNNIDALKDDVEYYTTADSVLAARAKRQSVTISELKADNSNLAEQVKKMGVKLRHLQSIQQVQQQSVYKFIADTIIIIDTITKEPIPTLQYHDDWIDFEQRGTDILCVTRDSLTVVRYQRKRKFLFWTFKKYTGQVSVLCANPHTKILGISEIDIIN